MIFNAGEGKIGDVGGLRTAASAGELAIELCVGEFIQDAGDEPFVQGFGQFGKFPQVLRPEMKRLCEGGRMVWRNGSWK